jgi:outer membrane protein OmpA-like peptidoglycan-associated protein
LLAAAVTATGIGLSACVSTDDFDKYVEMDNGRHEALSGRVDQLSGKVGEVDSRLTAASSAAQARADAAYTLAEGKFVMEEVSREEVNFTTGSAALSDEAKATLSALSDRLKSENKNVFIEVLGHADYRGGSAYNRTLGRERAAAVGRFLHEQGVAGNKMQVGSYGEERPKDAAKSSEALAENRRVEVVILR